MTKLLPISILLLGLTGYSFFNSNKKIHSVHNISFQTKTIYDFKVVALDGGTIDFAAFKGKKY